MSQDATPVSLQRRVRERAAELCEYCRIMQAYQEATFHIDHIVPRSAGGQSVFQNLALSCVSCSLRKGARQAADDPETGQTVPLFNPRRDTWSEHFQVSDDGWFIGLTPTGRATLSLLKMNRPVAVALRRETSLRRRSP